MGRIPSEELRRERANATDPSLDNARDGAATNTFYPLTLGLWDTRCCWTGAFSTC